MLIVKRAHKASRITPTNQNTSLLTSLLAEHLFGFYPYTDTRVSNLDTSTPYPVLYVIPSVSHLYIRFKGVCLFNYPVIATGLTDLVSQCRIRCRYGVGVRIECQSGFWRMVLGLYILCKSFG